MKNNDKIIVKKGDKYYECTVVSLKKKPTAAKTIYTVLDVAQKAAVVLTEVVKIARICEKQRLKKYGKIDKKSGMLILKKEKSLKHASSVKRY